MKPTDYLTIIRSAALLLVTACVLLITTETLASNITIDTVLIGNAGNGADTTGRGDVAYNYLIGKTEVTNAQYTAFLNAKATSDPLGLYDTDMASLPGGITRGGVSGSYSYATIPGREDMPVIHVSWYDAIRFTNWLHNGQGAGDTETGAYTLLGGTATPSNGLSVTRNAAAKWFLPSEDEWYKAAYHKNDGTTTNYFEYPTASDTPPTAEPPVGGSNSANYLAADLAIVGSYTASASPYGTFDQGGNVIEWNEALVSGFYRRYRGGGFNNPAATLAASNSYSNNGANGFINTGFRVATVPEPSSLVTALIGALFVSLCGAKSLRRHR